MKICAACHKDLPKESYSKKQWKLDKYQRRCKVCITNNKDVQPTPKHDYDDELNTKEILKSLDSICLEDVEKISDEELFKQPPSQYEDCPICFQRLPTLDTGKRYNACCGKVMCSGCVYAPLYDDQGNEVDNEKCPFCRVPLPESDEKNIKRIKKRVDSGNDAMAMHNLGVYYWDGANGFPQDYTKALELFHRARELDYVNAYNNIGNAYETGNGVEVDMKKSQHYYELAAIGGDAMARYNLGVMENNVNNLDRALKHHMIAVRGGYTKSLKKIKRFYSEGHASKEDYTTSLRSYQEYLDEIKSPQRDTVAATYDDCRYY